MRGAKKGNQNGFRHGHASKGRHSPEYRAWGDIKVRCLNPRHKMYPYYGGRGITICASWRDDFAAFFKEVGPRPSSKHTIDRFPDNNGNYEPGNVRWATRKEQSANRRTSRSIVINGVRFTIAEASAKIGIKIKTLSGRKDRGWTDEEILAHKPRRGFHPRSSIRQKMKDMRR